MFCPKCGKQVTENSKFCIYCGEQIDVPPVDKPPLPSFSGTSGSYQVPETKGDSGGTPTPGPYGEAGVQPDSEPEDGQDENEAVTPAVVSAAQQPGNGLPESEPPRQDSGAPQGRKSRSWVGIVTVVAVVAVIWAVTRNSPKSTVTPIPEKPDVDPIIVVDTWIDYASSEGSFSARFPSTPEYKSTSTTFAGVAAKYDTYTSDTGGELPWYTVVVYKFSGTATLVNEGDASAVLGGATGGMTGSGTWSSMSNSPVTTSNGYFIKDFLFKGTGDASGLYMIGRASMKYGNRMYLALITSEESNPATRDKFMASVTLK